jgi:hypothetical protein
MTGVAACFAGVGISGSGSGSGFSVSVPTDVTGSNSGAASSGSVSSSSATATPSGGTAPYTYAWARRSGDISIVISSPSAATTGFSATVSNFNTPKTGVFGVTVTDSLGVHVASADVSVSLDWIDTR